MTENALIEALEALHPPAREGGYWRSPVCLGCDSEGWESEAPAWPCRTAALIWPDPDERDALLADWHEWADAEAARVKAKYGAPVGFTMPREIWEPVIRAALSPLLLGRTQEAPDWTI